VKYSVKTILVALIAAASVTVSANLPVGTLTGEPITEVAEQKVSSLNAGMDGMVEANAIVQMASSYNSSPIKYNSSNDEVEVIKTKTLFINGKRVLVRPDGTLATKYAPTHRTGRRTVRRANSSGLALKKAMAKIKGVDIRLKNVEDGFDAVATTIQANQKTSQEALNTAKKALATTKSATDYTEKVGNINRSSSLKVGAIAGIAIILIIGIIVYLYLRRNREIGVSSYEFEEFVAENTAEHTDFANRIQALEVAVGIGAPLPEAGTDEEVVEVLAS